MSFEEQPALNTADCDVASAFRVLQRIEAEEVMLGEGLVIARALPSSRRRTIGAWCFLDHFGPADVSAGPGMRVGPHPHIGLQTVSWLLEGEVLHRDSLGYVQTVRPGQLNLMTAGRGISHSEESPAIRSARLHGAQLWIALPEGARHIEPAFSHHEDLPVVIRDSLQITVILGEAFGKRSPGHVFTPIVAMELTSEHGIDTVLPVNSSFEYGVLVLEGSAEVAGEQLESRTLLYLGCGRKNLRIRTAGPACVLLIGGAPFHEPIELWWNFVGRSKEEVEGAGRDWNSFSDYFGVVTGFEGERLSAPKPPWRA